MTLKKRPSRVAAMPPRVPESDDKTFGRWKVYKASPRWQKSTNRPSQPTSFSLSESLPPCRKARLLRRVRYGTSPGDRYVTPPKTLWHNYTSVALKGEGRRGRGGDGASERSGGVVGAGGCFTPGLFKETAQGMPLALLTKHFPLSPSLFFAFLFFLEYCWVRSSQILWAPVFPHSHLRMPQKLSRRHLGLFRCWCFKWIIHVCCGHAEGYLGSEDRWRFNVTLTAEGMSPHLSQQAARRLSLSAAFG